MSKPRIFLSMVTCEHKSLHEVLTKSLTESGYDVEVQERSGQATVDTVHRKEERR